MVAKSRRLPPAAMPRHTPRLTAAWFNLYYYPNQLGYNRLGVIISARVAKTSVARHRLKRILIEAVRRWPNHSQDLLFILKSNTQTYSAPELRAELARTAREFLKN